ncbi:MAG: KamA family radical SAM protein [Candidatus Delongbacteria bacterium]|nr:KamA family radical SAM protein [Candidatus Delongbacteria bacterium]
MWGNELITNVTTINELKNYVRLTKLEENQFKKIVQYHPMNITKYYLSLINKKDKKDPIRTLIVPSTEEMNPEGFYDTSGEAENTKATGLQNKYEQTALVLTTNECAAYCRHCFRKRLVGLSNKEVLQNFDDALNYIKKHKKINNVLLSGGDPLWLPTKTIEEFLSKLSKIPHLDFIRFGTRVPIVLPERIVEDKELLGLLKKYSKKDQRIYFVTHFNHVNEITKESIEAIDALINSNVIINNQTVLLKGVNDDPNVLAELQSKLVSIGVSPYYVFQCRPVKRVKKHFQVPFYKGIKIVEEAKKKLNGHSKRFKYMMSHKIGKIEIIGIMNNEIYFKQHQAKNPKDLGKFFKRKLDKKAGWLDDLKK